MTTTIALRPILARWKEDYGQTDNQLATYLGITIEKLGALAAESVPAEAGRAGFRGGGQTECTGGPVTPVVSALHAIAGHYEFDPARLVDVITNRFA